MPALPRSLRQSLLIASVVAAMTGCGAADTGLAHPDTWRVINYWAIWCAPCREEIPELNQLDQRADIVVLGVNYDGKRGAELADHAESLDIQFELLPEDPAALLAISRPGVLPTTLLVDPQGLVRDTLVGPQTADSILAGLKKAGKKTPAE